VTEVWHSVCRFPVDPARRTAWVKAIGRVNVETRGDWQPSKYSFVCSDHFLADDFIQSNGFTLLKQHAVPSVFSFPLVSAPVSWFSHIKMLHYCKGSY